jgi:hypothetical protein
VSLEEGWYLMSTSDLERELARLRGESDSPSGAIRLLVEDALAYRDAGNLPDDHGRSLRLVLHVTDPRDLALINSKRLEYEPDYHDQPRWRREGSKPVNVMPLRVTDVRAATTHAWWEQPELKALEEEWLRTGRVAGVVVPAAFRGFVYKTALSLRAAGVEVTPQRLADSIERWVPPREARRIREALVEANR